MPVIQWGPIIDNLQRSITPRGYTLGRLIDGPTCKLTCFYGEAGYPVAFIGDAVGLATNNTVAQKEAAKRLREAAEKHAADQSSGSR